MGKRDLNKYFTDVQVWPYEWPVPAKKLKFIRNQEAQIEIILRCHRRVAA